MQKTETIKFLTRTPENFHELVGGARDLRPIEIEALLCFPANLTGKIPLVIISIGSRGLTSGREELYTDALNQAGVATLIVDSFTGRGFAETASDQGKLSFAASAGDALFALDHIRSDERFDSKRVALLGYSRGGLATVMNYDRRLQNAVLGRADNFCAYVALYPPCYVQWENPQPMPEPLLAFFGGKDVQALATTGQAYMKRLNALGGRTDIIVYPEAVHSFDALNRAGPSGGINLALADIRVLDDGRMMEKTTGLHADTSWSDFLHTLRKRIGRPGSITGHGPLPRDIAVKPILDFLKPALAIS